MADAVPRQWLSFRGSEIQRDLHDYASREIESIRNGLESASYQPDVLVLQAKAAAWRSVLAFIHQHDTQQIKDTYGRE